MGKKKSGRIAVPFLLTIFIGLLIIGGAAVFIYNYFGLGDEEALKEPPARSTAEITYEDSHTILFILDIPEEKCSSTFVLMRSVPKDKKLLFVGIPTNTIAVVNGAQASMKDSYERGGASEAVNFAEQVFDVDIDRYMKLNSEAFIKICDIMGGVSYAVDVEISGFEDTKAEQYLNGQQIQTLLTYSVFRDGEVQRAYTASSLLAAMVNQADGQRISDSLDRSFNTVINMVETDITSVDYKETKDAIKFMLERGTSIARFRIMNGTTSAGCFVPANDFADDMIKEYFSDTDAKALTETTEEEQH